MAKFYDCIAYRWGWLNNHWYTVYVGDDKDKAIALAQCETQDRAGKYGVEVREWDGLEYKRIAYSPSTYGEQQPYTNAILYAREHIGYDCLFIAECETGTLPQKLLESLERHLEIGRALEKASKE